jgi:hypothetical protein
MRGRSHHTDRSSGSPNRIPDRRSNATRRAGWSTEPSPWVSSAGFGEIGVRVALGASKGDVFRLIIGSSMRLALMGVLLGIPAALALTKLMSGVLSDVASTDPVTYLAVVAMLGIVACLAIFLPAQRATRIDPLVALRTECVLRHPVFSSLLARSRDDGVRNRTVLTSQAIGMLLRNQLYAGIVDVPEYGVRSKRGDFERLISRKLSQTVLRAQRTPSATMMSLSHRSVTLASAHRPSRETVNPPRAAIRENRNGRAPKRRTTRSRNP